MNLKMPRFWTRIAALFLLRSLRSTSMLSLMVLTAVSSLILFSSLTVGINDAMVRNSVSLFSGHLTGLRLPGRITRDDLRVEGVENVLRRVQLPGLLLHGNHSRTVLMIGIEPAEEQKTTALGKKIVSGRFPEKGKGEVFLSAVLAEELEAAPGDSLSFGTGPAAPRLVAGASETGSPAPRFFEFHVSGIYKTGVDTLDRDVVFCPADDLPLSPDTWSAAVFLKDGVEPETVIHRYAGGAAGGLEFKSWAETMPDLRQLIDLNYTSMGLVTALVFTIVAIGIACAFVIFIFKSLREYGIMKAMGVTPRETAFLIFQEVVLLNLAATCAGIALGSLLVLALSRTGIDLAAFTSHNRYFAVSSVIYPRLTPYSLCLPPAVAFLFSLASGVWPAVLVARKKAVDILRMA